jgi:membrane protein
MNADKVPVNGQAGPDAGRKPSELRQLTRRSWRYLFGRSFREFLRNDVPDLAAGLTYYLVLAVLPGLIALASLLGLLGQAASSLAIMLQVARQVVPASGLEVIEPVLTRLTESSATTWGLVLGVGGALWFVSRYVAAFSRAMNRIYDVAEGRPLWKLQLVLIGITGVIGLLSLAALLLLAISRPLAKAIGNVLGIEDPIVLTWNIAKWPALMAIVVLLVALLYSVTPNVRQPRFRWVSPGAVLAIVTWMLASALFGVYVANFSRYDATYGSLGGVIIFLVWLWLTNMALLLGAVLDAEIERARELQAGMAAETDIRLPPRDRRASVKEAAALAKDQVRGRDLRQQPPSGSDENK